MTQFARVEEACRRIGRDPASMRRSIAQVVCVGRDDAEPARRAAAIGRDVDEVKANGLAGCPAEVVDTLGRLVEATGIARVYLQVLDLSDLDHIELIAGEVVNA